MADTLMEQDCPTDQLDRDIVKSPNDKKTYRHFKLANGVTVLLIHDPAVAAGLSTDATQKAGSAADASGSEMDDSEGSEGSEGSGGEDESSDGEDESSGSSGEEEGEQGVRKGKKSGSSAALATKKAAAAMSVGVGSFTDPAEMPGLAHYLEHMLFMGSDKYPKENEYDTFLNNHGGSSNAYTELEYTNYHFDVAPAHLEGALDRLAQFFVKPLFLAGSLEREVQAVDSEFKGVLQSDHSRLAQLMCHTCRPGHVYNKFSWGNALSLWDRPREGGLDVRQNIIDFYRRHYSAERMSLVVLGGQDLDTLQAWVQASFGDIPVGTAGPAASFEGQGMPFQGPPCLYLSPAVKEHHEVTVTFQLPCLRPNYPNKPEHYISHLVGHEGPGSLLSALKARGWALELCAGIDDDGYSFNTAAYLFTVNIVLTDAGLAAGPGCGLAPVGLLFAYLALLSGSEPQEWVYRELAAISDMKWRFLEEEDSCDFVTRLAATMGWVDTQHLLVADYLHQHWQPQRVRELLALMHPSSSNYRIDLLTKSFSSTQQHLTQLAAVQGGTMSDVHEPWFNMQAACWPLPESVISSWGKRESNGCVIIGAAEQAGTAAATAAAAARGEVAGDDLAFPPPNPFIPTDFSLKGAAAAAAVQGESAARDGAGGAAQDQQQQQQQEISNLPPWVLTNVGGRPGHVDVLLSTPPDMILDQPGIRLWHKLGVKYGQPRMVTYWRLSSPLAASSARASVLTALWLRLVEEAQAEEAYLADVAGLHWSSCPEGLSGLEVRMDGFSHKLGVLAARVFKALATPQLKAASFTAVCEELSRRYRNALLKPYHAANALRLQLLSGGPAWSHDELAQALEAVTGLEEVQIFAQDFLSCCHLESLIMGNVTAAEALTLCRDLASIINTPAAAAAAAAATPPAPPAAPPAPAAAAAAAGGEADVGTAGGGGISSSSSSSSRLVLCVADRPVEVCVQLPEGVEVLRVEPTRNPEEDNCCVEVYYQVGLSSTDLRLRVLADLVEQVVSEALYDTLRTKQQLGYTVSSGARLTHGVTGFCVVVVSAAFDAATVEQRIEAFTLEFEKTRLQSMGADEFARHKSSLVSNKLTSDTSMGQEADRAWEQVFSTRYEFVSREQEAAILQDVTLQELQSFYAAYISPASTQRRKLCIHITPTGPQQQQQQQQGCGCTSSAATKHPQEHVQHEFGVLHPSGEHTQHNIQHTSLGVHAVNGDSQAATGSAAAAGDGSQEIPSTRQSKRPRRQQQEQQRQGDDGTPASLSAVQAAPVEVISDMRGFKAAAGRYELYKTVEPQLKSAS